jgi:hypothetical protein
MYATCAGGARVSDIACAQKLKASYLCHSHHWHNTVWVVLHAVDLRHRPNPFEKVGRERGAVMANEHILWAVWHVVHAVLQEFLIHTLHVFVHRAHFCWVDKFGGVAQPCILVALARIVDEFDRVLVLPEILVGQIVIVILLLISRARYPLWLLRAAPCSTLLVALFVTAAHSCDAMAWMWRVSGVYVMEGNEFFPYGLWRIKCFI